MIHGAKTTHLNISTSGLNPSSRTKAAVWSYYLAVYGLCIDVMQLKLRLEAIFVMA
jgi:hypothetical protein